MTPEEELIVSVLFPFFKSDGPNYLTLNSDVCSAKKV
jgi:hypothetical protein